MRLVIVVGVRPQIIKLAPLLGELGGRHDVTLVHTGQHYEAALSADLFNELRLERPDLYLEADRGSRIARLSKGVQELASEIEGLVRPDALVTIGDSDPAYVGALVANVLGIPLAHIEAGLRSGDIEQPEERNRIVIDAASQLCFAPTPRCAANLRREGKFRVVLSGDLHLDALLWTRRLAAAQGDPSIVSPARKFVLVAIHRAATWASDVKLEAIMSLLDDLAMDVVWLAHPSTRERLKSAGIFDRLAAAKARVIGPQPHSTFVELLESAALVMTDSGGVQREAYFLRTRCLVLRAHTEFPETIGPESGVLADPGGTDLGAAAVELLRREIAEPDLVSFGAGRAAQRIVESLNQLEYNGE